MLADEGQRLRVDALDQRRVPVLKPVAGSGNGQEFVGHPVPASSRAISDDFSKGTSLSFAPWTIRMGG